MSLFIPCSWFYSVWLHAEKKERKNPPKKPTPETHCDFQIWLRSPKLEWMCQHTQFEGSCLMITELNSMIWESLTTTSNSPCTSDTAKSSKPRSHKSSVLTSPNDASLCVFCTSTHTPHTVRCFVDSRGLACSAVRWSQSVWQNCTTINKDAN